MSEAHENTPRKPRGRKAKVRSSANDIVALLQTPEAQAAIAAAVAMATNANATALADKRAESGTPALPGDMALVRGLAVAINELNGQNKKLVPAEVLEARREAREEMAEIILEARARGLVPEYELNRAQYLDEVLVAPTYTDANHRQRRTRIEWPNVPNEGMEPANDIAHRIFSLFMKSIGGATPNTNVGNTTVLAERHGDLKVTHLSDRPREAPHVGQTRMGDLKIVGRHQTGEIVETHVLGTRAAPARHLA